MLGGGGGVRGFNNRGGDYIASGPSTIPAF